MLLVFLGDTSPLSSQQLFTKKKLSPNFQWPIKKRDICRNGWNCFFIGMHHCIFQCLFSFNIMMSQFYNITITLINEKTNKLVKQDMSRISAIKLLLVLFFQIEKKKSSFIKLKRVSLYSNIFNNCWVSSNVIVYKKKKSSLMKMMSIINFRGVCSLIEHFYLFFNIIPILDNMPQSMSTL